MALFPDFKKLFGTSTNSTTATPALGVNIGKNDKNINQEIEQVTKQIQRTNKKYTDEIDKYKEIAKFNQKLTQSYVQNLQVIVDVSKLLEQYANVFYVLREETQKLEKTLGMDFNIQEFQYLENMTKDKMQELNAQFFKETEGIKKLYEQFGKPDEVRNISNAQNLMATSLASSKETFDKLQEMDKLSKMHVGGTKAKKNHLRKSNKSMINGRKAKSTKGKGK